MGKMKETFGEDVVVVPSLGNNDIYRESDRIGLGWVAWVVGCMCREADDLGV